MQTIKAGKVMLYDLPAAMQKKSVPQWPIGVDELPDGTKVRLPVLKDRREHSSISILQEMLFVFRRRCDHE